MKTYTTQMMLTSLVALTVACPSNAEARNQNLETTGAITVVDQEQIELAGNTNVQDAIRNIPGVVTDTYGNPYGTSNATNINLRGLGNNRSLTLLNGQRYMSGQQNYGQAGDFIPANIERVEVLRGPQGTLYGRNKTSLTLKAPYNIDYKTETINNATGYDVGTGYRYNYEDVKFNPGVNFDPKALGTTGIDPTAEYTPDTWDTTLGNTTIPTATTETATDTETTTSANTPRPQPTANNNDTTTPTTSTTDSNTPSVNYDGSYGNTYGGYRNPCDKIKIDWNKVAENYQQDAADQATGLIRYSQPRPFIDYRYYNTANDEMYNRQVIGNQLAASANLSQSVSANINGCYAGAGYDFGPGGYPDPDHPYVGGNDAPKTYYRVGHDFPTLPINDDATAGDTVSGTGSDDLATDTEPSDSTDKSTTSETNSNDSSTKTGLPPIPEYRTTVSPLNPKELTDGQLEIEIKYGPSLIEGYSREAKKLRDDAERYRKIAQERRDAAKKARADAERARKKTKEAKTKGSREFWEQQAEAYDSHADILEDGARITDRAAQSDDAAAKRYEKDAEQTAENLGRAVNELTHRQGVKAVKAAQEHAAREVEKARREAQRQRELDELLRRSQQSTQNKDTKYQNNNSARANRPYRPDGRIPRPGKESRNETLRKLLD